MKSNQKHKAMKKSRYFIVILFLFLQVTGFNLYSKPAGCCFTDTVAVSSETNYLIIGAFANFENATRFIKDVNKQNIDAEYVYNQDRGLYYIVDFKSDDKGVVLDRLNTVKSNRIPDAWIYYGNLNKGKMEDIQYKSVLGMNWNQIDFQEKTQYSSEEKPFVEVADSKNYDLIFNLIDENSQKAINGAVKLVNPRSKRVLKYIKTNQPYKSVHLTKTSEATFYVDQLGFEPQYLMVDFDDIYRTNDSRIKLMGNTITIDVMLKEKAIDLLDSFHDLRFFDNANIIRPKYKYLLDNLTNFLKKYPDRKIAIDGHTNVNMGGSFTAFNPDRKNYFTVSGGLKGRCSSKKLSLLRALTVKQYLVDGGVNEQQLIAKGWGAKQPKYSKKSSKERLNSRVDIQILN